MKFQLVLLFALVASLVMLVESSSDDDKCRLYAKSQGISDEMLEKCGPFRMYGYGAKGCQKTCQALFMDVGFSYVGNQACCCATEKLADTVQPIFQQ